LIEIEIANNDTELKVKEGVFVSGGGGLENE
jgi:hypothetical protein